MGFLDLVHALISTLGFDIFFLINKKNLCFLSILINLFFFLVFFFCNFNVLMLKIKEIEKKIILIYF
jgi:hypothetical protein